MFLFLSRAFLLSLALLALPLSANWPQWRGPELTGVSPSAHDLPVHWSPTENVVWKVKLPSWSAGTPVIWGDKVFVTSAQEGFAPPPNIASGVTRADVRDSAAKDHLYLLAIDRTNGKVLWRKDLGSGNRLYRKQNLSSPSPITDGKHVWAMTGAGVLAAFDMQGNEKWRRDIQKDYGEFGLNHGYASTPLLHNGRLYVQVLHGMKTDDPSYVFAVDAATGKTVWKVERPTDAQMESPDNYATPVLATVDGKQQLVISGANWVTGHDLATGKEIWRMGGFNPDQAPMYRTIASSIVVDGVVYTTSTRGRPFIAFRPSGRGDITDKAQVWKNDLGSDVPTPTTDGKLIYVLNDKGLMTAIDAKTGKVVYDRQRIEPGTYSASPLLADGKIYATSEEGTTTVLKAGPAFEVLAVNKLDSHTLASPAAVDDQLFIRTMDYLYCFAKKK